MSLPSFGDARDEILGLFNAAWTANAGAVNGGTVPQVAWPGVNAEVPDPEAAHVRVFLRHVDGRQVTFGQVGQRRFNRKGLVTIQVFTPNAKRTGLSLAENLATIARDAYEGIGTASGIWFRNVRIQEVGPDNGLYQMNVVAEFEYDELK